MNKVSRGEVLVRVDSFMTGADAGDGTIHYGLVLETNNPPACTQGYEGTYRLLEQARAADPNFDDQQQDIPFNTEVSCTAPQGSVTGVRGAARAVFSDPRVPQPWDAYAKTDPDKLNLTPIATQLAILTGLHPK